MTEVHSFGNLPVIAHAWNKDRTRRSTESFARSLESVSDALEIAVSLGKSDVRIYQKVAGKWKLTHTLSEHLSRVLAIDWAPKTDRIVSSSAVRAPFSVARLTHDYHSFLGLQCLCLDMWEQCLETTNGRIATNKPSGLLREMVARRSESVDHFIADFHERFDGF